MTERRLPGANLVRAWAVASALYVLVAGALSVAPIREALAQAAHPAAAAPIVRVGDGPVPEAPDTPAIKLAKAIGKQAAIAFAPPLLLLWFGWDLWFAIQGFWRRDRDLSGR
ncbi:MAG TPA: hypothetical protein VFE18_10275 [Phenylobacterium sp.]|jgi:hypothetical protein|uniref:hypothetical protein n=1 Tax=Phenylobacterium sp. TaxID=1871053 RepID=UPI002D69F93F|nr:hypothetical protein [Phenylobacterium sp.]HZZ68548.1 hypothetical protein [Phenylobacterium sp.]